MFLQSTPNTTGYMIAGYAVVLTVIGIYLFSLRVRRRNFERDLETLEALQSPKPKAKQKK